MNTTATKEDRFEHIKCPHCRNQVVGKVVGHFDNTREVLDEDGYPVCAEGNLFFTILCPGCSEISFFRRYTHSFEDYCHSLEQLHPAPSISPSGLPVRIQSAFNASLKVRSIDGNSYAVLSRRLLELICEDQKAEGKVLHEKLKWLGDKGILPVRLANIAIGLKEFGNIGAHATIGDIDSEDLPLIDALMKAVLEYIYSAPQLVETVEAKLESLKAQRKESGENPEEQE